MLSTVCVHRYVTSSVPHGQHYAGPFSLVSGHFRQHEGERERRGVLLDAGPAWRGKWEYRPRRTNTYKHTEEVNRRPECVAPEPSRCKFGRRRRRHPPDDDPLAPSGHRVRFAPFIKKKKYMGGPQLPPHHRPPPSASGTPRACLWWPTLAKHKAHRENKHLLAIDTTKMDDVIARELTSAQISDGKTELLAGREEAMVVYSPDYWGSSITVAKCMQLAVDN